MGKTRIFTDGLANGLIGSAVDGVLGEVKLTALPAGAGQHGEPGGFKARMIVRGDELDALQAARHKAFQEGAPALWSQFDAALIAVAMAFCFMVCTGKLIEALD